MCRERGAGSPDGTKAKRAPPARIVFPAMADLLFNLAMLPIDLLALVVVARGARGAPGPWVKTAAAVLAGGALAALACLALAAAFTSTLGWNPLFATLRFAAWGVFLHGTLLCE